MKMPLFQFMLPTHSNARRSYEMARKAFKVKALEIAGGFTALPFVDGGWRGPDKDYMETMEPLQVGCDQEKYFALVAAWFLHFPDQFSLAVSCIGEIEIIDRPAQEIAA